MVTLPMEQRKTVEMAFFRMDLDALGDRRDDRRPVGDREDTHTQRADDAEKGIHRMNGSRHIDQEDLALYAMQLLSAEEAAAITAHLSECDECRRELAAVQGDLAIYAHTVEMHSPPAQARERLMRQVAKEKKEVPVERTAPVKLAPLGDSEYGHGLGRGRVLSEEELEKEVAGGRSRVLPWIGWAVAAGLGFASFNLYQQRDALRSIIATQSSTMNQLTAAEAAARRVLDTMTDTTAKRVTLSTPAQTKPLPQGRATYVASKGALVFLANNMEPLKSDKVYELWLIPADGENPIPAGTFHPGRTWECNRDHAETTAGCGGEGVRRHN